MGTVYAIGLQSCAACGATQLAVSPVELDAVQCASCEQMTAEPLGTFYAVEQWPDIAVDVRVRGMLERLQERQLTQES